MLKHFLQKLEILEKEEDIREAAGMYNIPKMELNETMQEICRLAKQIRDKKAILKDESRINKSSTKSKMPRTAAAKDRDRSVSILRRKMSEVGVEATDNENVNFLNNLDFLILTGDIVAGSFQAGHQAWSFFDEDEESRLRQESSCRLRGQVQEHAQGSDGSQEHWGKLNIVM